jgi:2-polyprenyl-3-methyl-5-hydroxy-6-metoxy-1,4-benzoquinol methylase/GNAT superfamily N-acetyltransferase
MDGVTFRQGAATATDIERHLTLCSADFSPPLATRVDVPAYAVKLHGAATTYEAWYDDTLVGLIAIYRNEATRAAFITSVSTVSSFRRLGLARNLLTEALRDLDRGGYSPIELEVDRRSDGALKLYRSLEFSEAEPTGDAVRMTRAVRATRPDDLSNEASASLSTNRDHDLEFQDNQERRYSYDFDRIVREHLLRRLAPVLKTDGATLEVGAFRGDMTQQLLEYFARLDVIEASSILADEVRARFDDRVHVTTARIEDVAPEKRYQNIFLVHTLEHLDDPVAALSRIATWLDDDGFLFVAVTNANALSRQIAVHMGLIAHNSVVTPGEFEHGHRRTYSLDTLLADVRDAGLRVADFGGVIVKPLANFQFDRALEEGIVGNEYVEACDRLAVVYPDLAASVFACCTSKGR